MFSALDILETHLVHGIETCVQACLGYALPFVARYDKAPETDLDEELSCSLFTQSRENTHFVSNYAESLVTLYPQYPAKPVAEEDDMIFVMDDLPKPLAKKATKSKKGKAVAKTSVEIAPSPVTRGSGGGGAGAAAWTPVETGSFEYVLISTGFLCFIHFYCIFRTKPSLREILEQESKKDAPSVVAKKVSISVLR